VANAILAAEKDSEDADPLFLIIHVKPVDGPVDRQMAQTADIRRRNSIREIRVLEKLPFAVSPVR